MQSYSIDLDFIYFADYLTWLDWYSDYPDYHFSSINSTSLFVVLLFASFICPATLDAIWFGFQATTNTLSKEWPVPFICTATGNNSGWNIHYSW